MEPEAPARFSTMNGCFSESLSFAAISRASGSTEPPGGNGDTNFTGLSGQACAPAAALKHSSKTLTSKANRFIEASGKSDELQENHHQADHRGKPDAGAEHW